KSAEIGEADDQLGRHAVSVLQLELAFHCSRCKSRMTLGRLPNPRPLLDVQFDANLPGLLFGGVAAALAAASHTCGPFTLSAAFGGADLVHSRWVIFFEDSIHTRVIA